MCILYSYKPKTMFCWCHAVCRRCLWEDVDWPKRKKAGFLSPTVHTPAVSLSERMRGADKKGRWRDRGCQCATSPLFPSPLCTSSPRPLAQGLSRSSEMHLYEAAILHQVTSSTMGVRGALTQIMWPLNSSCTYKRYWNECDLLVEKRMSK